MTFEADAVAMALGRAASLLQNTQLPQEVESIEPWMPFTLKTVPQAKLLQLIANVVSSPQLIHNPLVSTNICCRFKKKGSVVYSTDTSVNAMQNLN